jgi:hypothetical protein
MKAFSVNKNSWHYRLNVRMCKTNDRLTRDDNAVKYVMSKDNLCSYWQLTLWSMFKVAVSAAFVTVIIFGVLFLLYLFGYALFFHTIQTLIGTAMALGVGGFLVGMLMLSAWLDKRKRQKLHAILYEGETETSLSKAKYSSWKSGICLPVEFK